MDPTKKSSTSSKGGGVQPLSVLEIPNSNGILTTDEHTMDKIAREAREKVFRGNVKGDDKMTNEFIAKYSKYIYNQKEEQIQPLDWRDSSLAATLTLREVWMCGPKKNFI